MLEKAFSGGKGYWGWMAILLVFIGAGLASYFREGDIGLTNDIPWGLFIGQYAFFVGIAASAVMVVLPYYLHDFKEFDNTILLGEFLAVVAVIMSGLFILADMGQPRRFFNLFLHPSPSSVLFWTSSALMIYMLLNLLIGWSTLAAREKDVPPPAWVTPLIYLSIPWAFSIHTTTAFVFAGLPGKPFWLTALMAARFLASAFASGPALLIICCLFLRRAASFDTGRESIRSLATFVAYAMVANVFFSGLELFTAFYSQIPSYMFSFQYLLWGFEGHGRLAPLMWLSYIMAVLAILLLIIPGTRRREGFLFIGCWAVFVSILIEKGFALVVGGFVPNPFNQVTEYWPTATEVLITLGIWATGFFLLSIFYKIILAVLPRPPYSKG